VSQAAPKALVVLRVVRGAPAPADSDIRGALAADRARLALPAEEPADYRLAGPYPVDLDGRTLDEYVVWEI